MRQSPSRPQGLPKTTLQSRSLTKPPVPPKPNLKGHLKTRTDLPSYGPNKAGQIIYIMAPPKHHASSGQHANKGKGLATWEELSAQSSAEKARILPQISQPATKELAVTRSVNPDLILAPIISNEVHQESWFHNINQLPKEPRSHTLSKNAMLLEKINGVKKKTDDRFLPHPPTNSLVTVNQLLISEDSVDNSLHINNNANKISFPSTVNMKTTQQISVNGILADKTPVKSDLIPTIDRSTYIYGGRKDACTKESLEAAIEEPYGKINRLPPKAPTTDAKKDSETRMQMADDKFCKRSLLSLDLKPAHSNHVSQSAPSSPLLKPQLQKADAFDFEDTTRDKRLHRGISRATDNVTLVSKARSELAQGLWDTVDSRTEPSSPFFVESPLFTFPLPDLTMYADDFRAFLEKDLIETSTLVSLESAGRLNWWASIEASRRLWPLATTGDGNCLLHAASLGMWGFHDRLLMLRKSLYEFLTRSHYSMPLWRRWRWQLSMQNRKTGLVYSATEWDEEWSNILRLASSTPRTAGGAPKNDFSNSTPNLSQASNSLSQGKLNSDCPGNVYESLEEIHVLALAHILRRPVIVVADTTLKDVNGAPFAPIPFGGIYLPLECPPKECQRSPLLLTYDAAHFSALVVMETGEGSDHASLPAVIPVTDCHHDLLPIQFVVDPGEDFAWGRDEHDPMFIQKLTITASDKKGLLTEYLNITQVPIPPSYLEAAAGSFPVDDTDSPATFFTENMEKKSSESSFDSDDGPTSSDPGRHKASKQMLTVVKQFGSIGRSMSKKIKKNLNTLSNFSRTGSFKRKHAFGKTSFGKRHVVVSTKQNFILAADIYVDKRYAYQEEMIKNYLINARLRFQREHRKPVSIPVQDLVECISPGCTLFGTSQTSYMCTTCYQRQRKQEEQEYTRQSGPAYGAGKSKFYADLDEASVRDAALIPTTSLTGFKDRTIFLSNSTFYNDSNIPSYNLNRARTESKNSKPKSGPLAAMPDTKRTVKTDSLATVSIDDRSSSLPCRNTGCDFYGSSRMDGLCSKCHSKSHAKDTTLNVEQASVRL